MAFKQPGTISWCVNEYSARVSSSPYRQTDRLRVKVSEDSMSIPCCGYEDLRTKLWEDWTPVTTGSPHDRNSHSHDHGSVFWVHTWRQIWYDVCKLDFLRQRWLGKMTKKKSMSTWVRLVVITCWAEAEGGDCNDWTGDSLVMNQPMSSFIRRRDGGEISTFIFIPDRLNYGADSMNSCACKFWVMIQAIRDQVMLFIPKPSETTMSCRKLFTWLSFP